MYTNMEQWTEILRAVLADGLSKREACRQFGIHFKTLQKILAHPVPPGYQRVAKLDRPTIGPWLGRLGELLEANGELPRKQRYQPRCRYWLSVPWRCFADADSVATHMHRRSTMVDRLFFISSPKVRFRCEAR